MIRPAASLPLLLFATSCGLPAQTTQAVGLVGPAAAVAVVDDQRLAEISGIVASRRHADCYYVHNDSGDLPRVFLIGRQGRVQAEVRLKKARAIDFEDIAIAPGEQAGTYDVCVADIGDNNAKRPYVTIYRFLEVDLPDHLGETINVEPAAYRLRYPDGPADAEGFLVDPDSGDGYVFTKPAAGGSAAYKLAAPWDPRDENVLKRVTTLELPPALLPLLRLVTAADVSPDGRRVAVRCYADGWEWRLADDAGAGGFERIFAATPARLSLAAEPQGEALCYSANGGAILTISEGPSPVLHEVLFGSDVAKPRANKGHAGRAAPASASQ